MFSVFYTTETYNTKLKVEQSGKKYVIVFCDSTDTWFALPTSAGHLEK